MSTLVEIGLSNAVVATILALVVFALSRLLRRRPALVHVLWLLVLIKLITPPLVDVPVFTLPTSEPLVLAETSTATIPVDEPAVPVSLDPDWSAFAFEDLAVEPLPTAPDDQPEQVVQDIAPAAPLEDSSLMAAPIVEALAFTFAQDYWQYWPHALLGVWLAGTLTWLLTAARRVRQFQKILKHASPADAEVQERAAYLASRLGLSCSPRVWLAPGVVSPMLWAIGLRARLILPAGLVSRLRPGHLDTLLLHELAHVRRRDHWVRWLELIATGLFWWHPVVWWARRELREAEEQCCDAWVIWALPRAARSYAIALVETVDFLSETRPVLPFVASGFGQVNDLKRRLTMILRGSTPRTLTWVSALAVVGMGAALLAVRPTFADDDDKRDQPPARERRDPDARPGRGGEQEKRPPVREGERGRAPEGERRGGGEEAERARNQVRELSQHLEKMQKEMQEVAQKLRQAQEQLSRLEGRPGGGDGAPGGAGRPGAGPGGAGGPGGRAGFGGGFPGGDRFGGGAGFGGFGGPGMPGAPGGDVERRLNEMEKKIDRLMQMMEGRGREGGRDTPQPPPVPRRGPDGGDRGRGEARPDAPPGSPVPPAAPRPPRGPGGDEPTKRRADTGREEGGVR